jgi:hypothetical protein
MSRTVKHRCLEELMEIMKNYLQRKEKTEIVKKRKNSEKARATKERKSEKVQVPGEKRKRSITGHNKTMKEAVKELVEGMPRTRANHLLGENASRKSLFPTKEGKIYEECRKRELFHIKHVRACMDEILPSQFKKNQHDHTKDELYLLVTSCAFNPELAKICELEQTVIQKFVKEHTQAEAHHPEYEEVEDNKITVSDIIETVVDRLSRNLQFNGGKYNKEEWGKYEPKYLRDPETRLRLYRLYQENLADQVEKIWNELKKSK